nr:MAG TPA: hypothetical protein [Caudoviricetes sp.]
MTDILNLEVRPDGSKHYVLFSVEREKNYVRFRRDGEDSISSDKLTEFKARQIADHLLRVTGTFMEDVASGKLDVEALEWRVQVDKTEVVLKVKSLECSFTIRFGTYQARRMARELLERATQSDECQWDD